MIGSGNNMHLECAAGLQCNRKIRHTPRWLVVNFLGGALRHSSISANILSVNLNTVL